MQFLSPALHRFTVHRCGSGTVVNAPHSDPSTKGVGSRSNADVAQLVEHHLAKVRVAGSNPVVRSEPRALVARPAPVCGGVAERRGNGLQSRLHGFKSRLHLGPAERGGADRPTGRIGRLAQW